MRCRGRRQQKLGLRENGRGMRSLSKDSAGNWNRAAITFVNVSAQLKTFSTENVSNYNSIRRLHYKVKVNVKTSIEVLRTLQ